MISSLRVQVAFGDSEINHVYLVLALQTQPDQEVLWLNVSVNEANGVQLLYSGDALDGYLANSFN